MRFVYILQPAFMTTVHLSADALARGVGIIGKQSITGQRDPARLAAAEEEFGPKSLASQEFIAALQDSSSWFISKHPNFAKLLRPVRDFLRSVQRLASSADPLMRELSWHIYYAAAKDYLVKFRAGRVDWNTVDSRLKLELMHPSTYLEMTDYVRRGLLDKAAAVIAEAKSSASICLAG
jgi:hypothetical protein